ncbi:hypothetical protein D3C80_1871950 [compost metagenome]
MAVSGKAAASRSFRVLGAMAAMRSSTSCRALLLPGRLMSPAYQTLSPALNRVTSLPTATTSPTASQPKTRGVASTLALGARTLVSTGLMEVALTRTSRSRGPGVGSGSSVSMKQWG